MDGLECYVFNAWLPNNVNQLRRAVRRCRAALSPEE